MSTYLVTGGAGFVGSELIRRLLNSGHRVVALARDDEPPSRCTVIRGSVEDIDVVRRAVARYPIDGVFHLAAHAKVEECRRDVLGCFESNVRGTYILLSVLAQTPTVPVVVATTDHVYGDHKPGDAPSKESDPFVGGGSAYDISKAAADSIAMGFGQTQDVRVVRCVNIYGPGDRDMSRVVPSMVDDVTAGRAISIRSDGTPVREYLYVDDAVDAYVRAMYHGKKGQAYNIGTEVGTSVIELSQRIFDVTKVLGYRSVGASVILGTRTGDISQIRLDSSKAHRELGWHAATHLDRGLFKTIEWWSVRR